MKAGGKGHIIDWAGALDGAGETKLPAGEVPMMRELVTRSRSYRRFQEERQVEPEVLTELIEIARLTPSASNKQPLKYLLSRARERNDAIFGCLRWAAYLADWPGPAPGERPTAYVVILGDKEIAETVPWDHAVAAQTIMLAAAEKGLAGCIIANIDRERLRRELVLPARYQILLVVALGFPHETVVVEEMRGGDYKYWRDEEGVHHVPKRPLAELILDL
jgi:nitroreductase